MGDQGRRFIPIDQVESAYQAQPDTLLAQDVYHDLLGFIGGAQKRAVLARQQGRTLDESRLHSAVLLDGKRGTGKSSVLVNLPMYLESKKCTHDWIDRVHVLKPVDPTLLEDHNDLFLNVIVAAVLSDDAILIAQRGSEKHRKDLALRLQSLGHALEKMQSQDDTKGLDKLRAFMGNQELVKEVHEFFGLALKIIDKDLLVLTIDDVDTSLSKAFENLEIVRRYLTTPNVLPIISGDGELYSELTWRDFHGRITEDSNYQRGQAYHQAKGLAHEYQRKVLPLQYRLRMPEISAYIADPLIYLQDASLQGHDLQLRAFHEWLVAFIMGPVNGLENSMLDMPVTSIRALTQLVHYCRPLISNLPSSFRGEKQPGDIAHVYHMPAVPRQAVQKFEAAYRDISRQAKREYANAYVVFGSVLNEAETRGHEDAVLMPEVDRAWCERLRGYFKFEPKGGAAFLVLTAQQHWYSNPQSTSSIFDTPLFQPQKHRSNDLSSFEPTATLDAWQPMLKEKLPQDWFERLPSNSILAYPVPEVGGSILRTVKFESIEEKNFGLVMALMVHRNYYSTARRGRMVCIGRVVELVVASVVRDLEVSDIFSLLSRAPFYSTATVAATKMRLDPLGEDGDADEANKIFDYEEYIGDIVDLVADLKAWRRNHDLDSYKLSPWLVYNVFNKVMSQAWVFNEPSDKALDEEDVVNIAAMAFNSLWAAFGSFEKGQLFGLPALIATVNPSTKTSSSISRFESSLLFTTNILPFFPRQSSTFGGAVDVDHELNPRSLFGKTVRSMTYCLGDHPLRKMLRDIIELYHQLWSEPLVAFSAPQWISSKLNIGIEQATVNGIKTGLRNTFLTRQAILEFKTAFLRQFPGERRYTGRIESAVRQVLRLKKYRA
ncbi:antiviral RADAR system adenosine triphosphatase RdrA [Pseudomonas urmiensis]|uniref:antiviral RADAR system adenosine triphosphatase RdrA n=1 Tax=Pseudomonas urmiensis TaxID=2745493 RepID=UPI003D101CD1